MGGTAPGRTLRGCHCLGSSWTDRRDRGSQGLEGLAQSHVCQRAGLHVSQAWPLPPVLDVGILPAFGSRRPSYCEYVGVNTFLIFFSFPWTVSLRSSSWSGTPAGRHGVNSSHSAIRKEPIYSSYQNRELTAAKPVLGLTAVYYVC